MYWILPRSETSLTAFGATLSRPLTVTQIQHFNTQILKRTFINIPSTQWASLMNMLLNSYGDYHRIGTSSFEEHVGTLIDAVVEQRIIHNHDIFTTTKSFTNSCRRLSKRNSARRVSSIVLSCHHIWLYKRNTCLDEAGRISQ